MKVYKYPLVHISNIVSMPAGARIVCVQTHAGIPTLWALVDPEKKQVDRHFCVVGTGQEVSVEFAYVGTCFPEDTGHDMPPGYPNGFVWHIFEN